MARPSSSSLASAGPSSSTASRPAGRRWPPAAAAAPRQLKLSERTPTVTPVPLTPKALRAISARIAASPWLVTAPHGSWHRPGARTAGNRVLQARDRRDRQAARHHAPEHRPALEAQRFEIRREDLGVTRGRGVDAHVPRGGRRHKITRSKPGRPTRLASACWRYA